MPDTAPPAYDPHPHPVGLPPTHIPHLLSLLLWSGGAGGKLDRAPTPRRGDTGDHGGHGLLLQAVQQVKVHSRGERWWGESKNQDYSGSGTEQ